MNSIILTHTQICQLIQEFLAEKNQYNLLVWVKQTYHAQWPTHDTLVFDTAKAMNWFLLKHSG